MARNGVASRWRRADKLDGWDLSPSDSEDVHVLAVDDSLVDRKVIERLLRITSCTVTAVDSGMRALQFLGLDEEKKSSVAFNRLKVDLIITDYCMPGMTGYELLKKIKESSTFKEIPVVIMSSENVLARIDRCLEEGAEDFLVKPVKLSDVKRLRSYLTKEAKMRNESGNKRKLPEPSDQTSIPSPPSVASPPSSVSAPSSPLPSPLPSRSPLSPSSPSPLAAPSSPSPLAAPSSPSPLAAPSSPSPLAAPSSPSPLAAPSSPSPLAAPSSPSPLAAPSSPSPLAAPSSPSPLAAPSSPSF